MLKTRTFFGQDYSKEGIAFMSLQKFMHQLHDINFNYNNTANTTFDDNTNNRLQFYLKDMRDVSSINGDEKSLAQ